MKKLLLTGDEAVARGAWEAGCTFATAYPGTPSTEILENMATYKDDVHAQWASNEKVAMESAVGASMGGVRVLVSMKHVGMNVAADPMFTSCYTGVTGGLVIADADDPGMHSSQNEQDNRHYAVAAKLPMLEPSDSEECRVFVKRAFELSEAYDTPVILRMTTRVCHSKSLVTPEERVPFRPIPYVRQAQKNVMLPAHARPKHPKIEKKLVDMEALADDCPFNYVVGDPEAKIGIISAGAAYQYAREVFDEKFGDRVKYLKLGMTFPMPRKCIQDFCTGTEQIYVIEEGDDFMQVYVERLGFSCVGKPTIPFEGELNCSLLRAKLFGEETKVAYQVEAEIPPRPPVLCAGCPHRGFFYALKNRKKELVACGDIGCYTLGVSAPLDGFDTNVCMGGGFSIPIGLSKALEQQGDKRKVFGLLGDSTFFHSGITGLVDIVHSGANVCACVLDNSATAMTGHQEHPGTPRDLMGNPVPAMQIEAIVRATGIPDDRVRIVDPVDQTAMADAVSAACAVQGPFVIIARRPCALLKEFIKANAGKHCVVDREKCKGCQICTKMACPALALVDGKAEITDTAACTGCGLCMQLCKFGAISKVGE